MYVCVILLSSSVSSTFYELASLIKGLLIVMKEEVMKNRICEKCSSPLPNCELQDEGGCFRLYRLSRGKYVNIKPYKGILCPKCIENEN